MKTINELRKGYFATAILIMALLLVPVYGFSQVTIGAGTPPDTDAILDLVSNDNKGLLVPRVVLVSTSDPTPLTRHVEGMTVYNTGTSIAPGYYFNNGIRWIAVADGNSVSWRSAVTNQGATSNEEDIYQMGAVSVGTSAIDSNAIFDVNSTTRGVLLPRLTTGQRDAIPANVADGLLIYNVTTNCFNYFDGGAVRWVSLCGTFDPATFNLLSCDAPTGPAGTYTQGTSLSTANTYTVVLNVTEPGIYQIVASTNNGYSFSASGTFLQADTYTIVLAGQGTPVAGPQSDAVTITFNGIPIVPSCTLPLVNVVASITAFSVSCTPTINGTYLSSIAVDGSQYVDIPIGSIITSGSASVETNTVNGLRFSTGSVPITQGTTTSIRLFAQGTPTSAGTYTYSFTPPGGTLCSFNITVGTSLGTLANPATSCYTIYQADPTSVDGEYWVGTSGNAFRTFCDMTNGGYTLLWSYSEKTARAGGGPYGNANTMNIASGSTSGGRLATNLPRNTVTTQAGTINYYDYRLPLATMQTIRSASSGTTIDYRVRIAEVPTDMSDAWGADNYFGIALSSTSAYDFIIGTNASTCVESNVPTYGKIFGYIYDGRTNTVTYNGVAAGNICPYTVSSSYGAHWDAGTRLNGAALPAPNGGTFLPSSMNNLFGYFGETEGNHLFGKCGAAGSDTAFSPATCTASNLHPHAHLNNNGEGRTLQWFVK